MSFIDSHWGDLVALLVLFTGLAVSFAAAIYKLDTNLATMGQALATGALLGLKLRTPQGQ